MAFDKRKALQNALTYTQQGKWDRAIAEYQAIVKADPRDLTVCNNLGDLYARVGKPGEAIEQYLKLGELFRTEKNAVALIQHVVPTSAQKINAVLGYVPGAAWRDELVWDGRLAGRKVAESLVLFPRPQPPAAPAPKK